MMAGISLIPPPPVPPDLPVLKEIIHCKSCTLFPQNPSKFPHSHSRPEAFQQMILGSFIISILFFLRPAPAINTRTPPWL